MTTTRHDVAIRVARREFDTVQPRCKNLLSHVTAADISDWLAAHDPCELSEELADILGDDHLAQLGLDTSDVAERLYTHDALTIGCFLQVLRDRYATLRIAKSAHIELLEMIDRASLTRDEDLKQLEIDSRADHEREVA